MGKPKKKLFRVEIPVKAYIVMEVKADNEEEAIQTAIQTVEIRTIGGDSDSENFTGVVGKQNSLFIPPDLQYNQKEITILKD